MSSKRGFTGASLGTPRAVAAGALGERERLRSAEVISEEFL